VADGDVRALLCKVLLELREAADVASGDDIRVRPDARVRARSAEACGDFGLIQIVGSRAAAAEVRVGEIDRLRTRDRGEQRAVRRTRPGRSADETRRGRRCA